MASLRCVLPAVTAAVLLFVVAAVATDAPDYLIKGRVYCDTCRAGFETNVTEYLKGNKYAISLTSGNNHFADAAACPHSTALDSPGLLLLIIAGAKVRLECKHFGTGAVERAIDGVTDETGTYKIELKDSHEEDICEVVLVQSPRKDCAEVQALRDRASVLLTRNVGICDSERFANPLGYFKDVPLPVCAALLKQFDLDNQDE
ncbi:Pollen-specific protein C13 [Dichanthelium oligosanthes]|uniref:Pollen-specific protein C13 n=1 Tax=Dichanthelium oligosanthes TaxID=888268 RepID=A0A1E5WHQ1_9POAL|nr:Pollen-specific protein C13 [Dichanthelium oligosanthes]